MNRIVTSMLLLGLSLAVVAAGCTARVNPKEERRQQRKIHGKRGQSPRSNDSVAKSPLMKKARQAGDWRKSAAQSRSLMPGWSASKNCLNSNCWTWTTPK